MKGLFSSNFAQNDQIFIREIKETHETGQNSIFVNRLVFPLNFNQFNRFSHPMTLGHLENREYVRYVVCLFDANHFHFR